MSRIRSIHPGLWTDEAFMGLSVHARLFFMGLWNEAFDDGVFEWKVLTLKARIFPVDDVDVPALLEELLAAGCIRRIDGAAKAAGAIRNFRKFQRPKTPNASGLLPDGLRDFVGLETNGGETVPARGGNGSAKPAQREEGGESSPQPPVAGGDTEIRSNGVWAGYPTTLHCTLSKAQAAFDVLSKAEQRACVAGVAAFRRQFEADKAVRATRNQGPPRVQKLENWIKAKGWEGLAACAVPPTVELDRDHDRALWQACETLRGKRAPTSGNRWRFDAGLVARARTQLADTERPA